MSLTRRSALAASLMIPSPFAASPVPVLAEAESQSVTDYHLLMARKADANASPVWADVERWCEHEAAALTRLADAKGDLRDLLAKVLIVADRADEAQWNMQDEEYDLFASMREQALELMRANGSQG